MLLLFEDPELVFVVSHADSKQTGPQLGAAGGVGGGAGGGLGIRGGE